MECDGRTEEAFDHEDALGMVAKRTMAKVGGDRLGLVEPLVEREVVLRDPAPFTNRREGVMIAMSHRRLLTKRGFMILPQCSGRCDRPCSSGSPPLTQHTRHRIADGSQHTVSVP